MLLFEPQNERTVMLATNSKALLAATLVTAVCGCATAESPKTAEQSAAEQPASPAAHGFVKPSSPMPISSYLVDLPSTAYKSAKFKEVQLEPQILFLDEDNAKKAFEKKDELQKLVGEVIQKSKTDLKSPTGKFMIKGEILAKLNQHGYNAEGVVFGNFRF